MQEFKEGADYKDFTKMIFGTNMNSTKISMRYESRLPIKILFDIHHVTYSI